MPPSNVIVAFVSKQDPHRQDGQPGPLLSAAARLPFIPEEALLVYVEGASDRADARDGQLAEGTQALRAEEVAQQLRGYFQELAVELVELQANPTAPRALLSALKAHPTVRAFRNRWQRGTITHLLNAGGTPAMRELLSALQVGEYFGRTQGWYAPDRGTELRSEVPLVAEAVYIAGTTTAIRVGEYTLALRGLAALEHPDAASARTLLTALVQEQAGDVGAAARTLDRWTPPPALAPWRSEAGLALHFREQPEGFLMAFCNQTQEWSPRPALLAYATLLEVALRTLCQRQGVRIDRRATAIGMVNQLSGKMTIPEALNAASGLPFRLYEKRNQAIHHGEAVRPTDLPVIQQAATDLLQAFPAVDDKSAAFLRAPHRNAFAPGRREGLAQAVAEWLGT